jgi:hypothetical protein
MRAHLRHKAAKEVWKAKDKTIRQGQLAMTEERQGLERQVLDLQQDKQRRNDKGRRDDAKKYR